MAACGSDAWNEKACCPGCLGCRPQRFGYSHLLDSVEVFHFQAQKTAFGFWWGCCIRGQAKKNPQQLDAVRATRVWWTTSPASQRGPLPSSSRWNSRISGSWCMRTLDTSHTWEGILFPKNQGKPCHPVQALVVQAQAPWGTGCVSFSFFPMKRTLRPQGQQEEWQVALWEPQWGPYSHVDKVSVI